MEFVILPMVWRAGACLIWENRIGCLVKLIDDNSKYRSVRLCYSELETMDTPKSLMPLRTAALP